MNRRELLQRAGAAALLAGLGVGGGIGLSQLDGDTRRRAHRFRTRPDLRPPVAAVARSGETAPGHVFCAPMGGPGTRGPLILDDAGEPVWVSPTPKGLAQLAFSAQTYRGGPVLTWWEGRVAHGYGQGEYVVADASYRELARLRAGNGLDGDLHEFLLTPDGTALLAIYDSVDADGRKVVEGVVQEIDVATGDVVFEWHSLDHVPVRDSYTPLPEKLSSPYDYFHLNSIGIDVDGHLLVSARHTCAVYKLDRRSGRVLWRLGGKRGDFALGHGARTWFQHDARGHADGTLTLFDNGAAPKREPFSRALTLALDTARKRATVVRADAHAGRLANAMGSTQRLPGGGLFVGWGTVPYASEFAPDGTVVYDLRFPDGAISYRALRLPWHATPADDPRLVAAREGRGARLHASWNGATEVVAWQAYTGDGDARLGPVEAALRRGFETELRLERANRYVAVAAVDASGRELGRSQTIRV